MAILLSTLCLVHCLLLPLGVALLPWLAWFAEHDSVIHRWLLLAIVPVSAYALIRGCAQHGQRALLWLGVTAVGLLVCAELWEPVPEFWESLMTLGGSAILSLSHLFNLRALRAAANNGAVHA